MSGCSFNGAIAFQRWKATETQGRFIFHGRASMGPSPFSDGRSSSCRTSTRSGSQKDADRSFNGAIAFQRWKVTVTSVPAQLVSSLQWGHRLSAMEGWAGT